jgi:hypothetical protein
VTIGTEAQAEVDLGPLVLNAIIDLHASIDTLNKRLRNIAAIEAAYQDGAIEVPLRNAAVSAASGSLIMGLGGPRYGRLWEVKRLTIGGAQWTSVVAGQALIVVSPTAGQLTPALGDIADQAGSLPLVSYYSTRQLTVRHPNHLYVVILTPTASTQYSVGGQATDYPDKRLVLDTEN